MKNIGIVILLSTLMLATPIVAAQDTSNPILLPDNILYPLQRLLERVQTFFAFSPETQANLHLQLAERRLAELNVMNSKNNTKFNDRLENDFENELNETVKNINRTQALGRNATELAEHVAAMTFKHQLVLQNLLNKVPERARKDIENAINASKNGHMQAVMSILRSRNVTGTITLNFTIGNQTFTETYNITMLKYKPDIKRGELEIEAQIENNQTFVIVERNKITTSFTLNTTTREEIVTQIIDKTGLSRSQVESNLEIEAEEE